MFDGETKKAVPIRIIDDFTPEVEEEFTVELMNNSVAGGARVGTEYRSVVTIEESDDPYGLFGKPAVKNVFLDLNYDYETILFVW